MPKTVQAKVNDCLSWYVNQQKGDFLSEKLRRVIEDAIIAKGLKANPKHLITLARVCIDRISDYEGYEYAPDQWSFSQTYPDRDIKLSIAGCVMKVLYGPTTDADFIKIFAQSEYKGALHFINCLPFIDRGYLTNHDPDFAKRIQGIPNLNICEDWELVRQTLDMYVDA